MNGDTLDTTSTLDAVLATLSTASYGAPSTYTLHDGRVLRASVDIDDSTNIVDDAADDGYYTGRLVWQSTRSTSGMIYRDPRPADVDGSYRIVYRDYRGDGVVWWQVPSDVVDPDDVERLASHIREMIDYGYVVVVVEVLDGVDAYGRGIVRDSASLWGVESTYDAAYLAEVVSDLLAEMLPDGVDPVECPSCGAYDDPVYVDDIRAACASCVIAVRVDRVTGRAVPAESAVRDALRASVEGPA